MSLLFARSTQARGISYADFWGRGSTSVDLIENDNVLRVIPVYAAVSLIADSLSTLPAQQYRGTGTKRERIETEAFLEQPTVGLTWVDWMHQLMVSLLLRGNAYGIVTRSPLGIVTDVRWVHPDRVSVSEFGTFPIYSILGGEQVLDLAHGGPILHIRSFVMPSKWKGISPISLFQEQYQMWDQASKYGRTWFEQSGVPTGILKNAASTLDRAQTKVAKASFQEAMSDPGPIVLDKNWDWTKVSVSPEEAQFLNTIKAGSTQIAAIFRVDPDDIGGESNSGKKYSNREQDQVRFNTRTLLPWTVRLELALKPLLQPGTYLKLNLDGLARPDLVSRVTANNLQLKGGQITLEELRAQEDRPRLTDAEVSFWQDNYSTMRSESVASSTSSSISEVKDPNAGN